MTWSRVKARDTDMYGPSHATARKQWAARHDPADPCVRCRRPLGPMGPHLHLDHHDSDKSLYLGFSHRACNLRAAGQLGNARQRARRRGQSASLSTTSLRW